MYLKWQQLYFSTSVLVGRFIDQYQVIFTFFEIWDFYFEGKTKSRRKTWWMTGVQFNLIWAVMVKESIANKRSSSVYLIHGAKRINPFEFDNSLNFPLKPVFLAFKQIVQQL